MAIVYSDVNEKVAHLPGVVAAVRALADAGGAAATGILRSHFAEGESEIEVTYGDTDAWVSLVDPAAVSIEYGRTGARGRGRSQGIHAVTGAFGITK